jgi:ADP-ribose diphosphatase
MRKKPDILKREIIAKTRLFTMEALDLVFSNGAFATFQRLLPRNHGAVMVAPILGDDVLLVREYAAGVDRYELGFPKGIVEGDEDPLEAANREIQEEVGYGAKKLEKIRTMTAVPGYMNSQMTLILATDLYPAQLPGDEPEPLEVVPWPLKNLEGLLEEPDFTDGRSIAGMFLIKRHLVLCL